MLRRSHEFTGTDRLFAYTSLFLAYVIRRRDEGAADIVVADDAELEGDLRFLGEAERRRHAGIGHRDHHVGLDRAFARQLGADALARLVDAGPLDHRIGPGEIDVFEDAEAVAGAREGPQRVDEIGRAHV